MRLVIAATAAGVVFPIVMLYARYGSPAQATGAVVMAFTCLSIVVASIIDK